MTVRVSPTPATLSGGRILVALDDTAGRPVPDAVVQVTGQMTHAGMVPVVDTASQEAPGRYAVPAFGFTMAGDWVLEVRARLPDGREAAADQPIRVADMGGGPDAPGGADTTRGPRAPRALPR
jgi:hypothetical protein